jgi:hypothetical protein
MQLTKEQKDILKELKASHGFRLLQLIEKEALDSLGRLCLDGNLDDPKVLETIKLNKIYAKARSDFLFNTDKHLSEIYTPKV